MTGSLVGAGTRQRVRDLATPIAAGLGRLGLTPNALTLIGFGGTAVAGWAAASQWWLAAGVLVLAFGIFDLFDGALARATGRASSLGAFLDSTFDRAGECLVYIGVAAGCLAAGSNLGAILAASAMAASTLVSYVRAKAESLGFAPGSGLMNVGLAPREVRLVILAVGLAAAGGLGGAAATTVIAAALAVITTLATITVIQRIVHVRAQAGEG
ncbi:MAG TPA: CDP-alcohol phosphatidyltransferase family protein [Candidatus Limnocylindrales bacterium]|nr:CDP-alcohol phosphatidyltransferase family protein [Candidatus Limnocylindrales bacterium]